MTLENVRCGKLLYHLTELDNLASIITGQLLPRKDLIDAGLVFTDIADTKIIDKREQLGLDNFTPFHFHPYSAFDLAVKRQHRDKEFIYLCVTRILARENDFKIIPSHPMNFDTGNFIMYEYDEGSNKIDWRAMSTYGNDDDYIKHVKMAECLTDKPLPIQAFQCIFVKSSKTEKKILELFKKHSIRQNPPYINVLPDWFD